ncbi:hypothetical protein ABZ639_26740 [Saccharomonospora sp. NPDC006951]
MVNRKHIAGAMTAAAAVMTLAAAPATGAPAASGQSVEPTTITIKGKCGDGFSPDVRGGRAAWNITCANGVLRVQGWVQDTKADGKAAELYGTWGDGKSFQTVRAGGVGKIKRFDRSRDADTVNNRVDIRLRVI